MDINSQAFTPAAAVQGKGTPKKGDGKADNRNPGPATPTGTKPKGTPRVSTPRGGTPDQAQACQAKGRGQSRRGPSAGAAGQVDCSICGKEYDAGKPRQVLLHIGSQLHRAALAHFCGCDPSCSCAEHCSHLLRPPERRNGGKPSGSWEPGVCRFGATCKRAGCTYSHPEQVGAGAGAAAAEAGAEAGGGSLTAFVANVSFETTLDELKDHFQNTDGLLSAEILTRKDGRTSKGSAILTFATEEAASAARENMTGTELGGRQITVRELGGRQSGRGGGRGATPAPEPEPEDASESDGASNDDGLRGLVQQLLQHRAEDSQREPALVSALLRCPVHRGAHTTAGFDVPAILASIESGEALKDDAAEPGAVLLEPVKDWLVLEGRSHVGWRPPQDPNQAGAKSMRTAVPVAAATWHTVINSLPPQFVGLGKLPRTITKPKPKNVPIKWPNEPGKSLHNLLLRVMYGSVYIDRLLVLTGISIALAAAAMQRTSFDGVDVVATSSFVYALSGESKMMAEVTSPCVDTQSTTQLLVVHRPSSIPDCL